MARVNFNARTLFPKRAAKRLNRSGIATPVRILRRLAVARRRDQRSGTGLAAAPGQTGHDVGDGGNSGCRCFAFSVKAALDRIHQHRADHDPVGVAANGLGLIGRFDAEATATGSSVCPLIRSTAKATFSASSAPDPVMPVTET